ncbi:MAG TPA: hypothetical protein VLG50_05720 [Candidatus Saccharimonadales bacterium]|nr:hypothetical protein [Candidatus Saccharimonadales bacterium]
MKSVTNNLLYRSNIEGMRDLRPNILSNINFDTYNINDLINICNTDTFTYNQCSSVEFWKAVYKKENLIFPKFLFKTPIEWIIDYKKEKKIQFNINEKLSILNIEDNDYFNSFRVNSTQIDLRTVLSDILNDGYIETLWSKWLLGYEMINMVLYPNEIPEYGLLIGNTDYTLSFDEIYLILYRLLSANIKLKLKRVIKD